MFDTDAIASKLNTPEFSPSGIQQPFSPMKQSEGESTAVSAPLHETSFGIHDYELLAEHLRGEGLLEEQGSLEILEKKIFGRLQPEDYPLNTFSRLDDVYTIVSE